MERTSYPNGKDLITIEWKTWEGIPNTLALYKEEYRYGGGLALFMWDITEDEPWGDVSVNLSGSYLEPDEIFLNEYVEDDTIKALKGIITYTGEEIPYNYGMFKIAKVNMSIINKLPNQAELMDMLYSNESNEVPTL